AEQVANTNTDDAADSLVSDDQSAKDSSVTDDVLAENEAPTNEMAANAIEELAADNAEKSQADIVPVRVDEIGIYELLKKKLAA
ncbi:hypothetical protein NOJ16_34080, partial [Neorhizobium galegae]|nr:hypothetical protein [Neorhizobium galegae]